MLATLSVSAVFATCSGILALAEKRRKRKGLSLARAWSLPHGMPMVSFEEVDEGVDIRMYFYFFTRYCFVTHLTP